LLTVKYGHPVCVTRRLRSEVDEGERPFDLRLSAETVQGASEAQGGSYRVFKKNLTTSCCIPDTSSASHCDMYTEYNEFIYRGC
jgi:hypothetical protein